MSDREIRQLEKAKCKAQRSRNLKEEAAICNQLGELLARSGRFQDAIEEHRQELGICEGLGDVIGCAVANRKIGESFAELGNYEAALKHQRLHLKLAQSVSSDVEEQRALATIGRTYLYMCEAGNTEARAPAEEAFLKSLAIVDDCLEGKVTSRELSEMRARLFLNLGFLYDIMGQSDTCSVYIRKSIFISEQTQLHEDLYRANITLAGIHVRTGHHSKAIRCWEAARERARRMRDRHMESECYCSIGQILLSLGDLSAGKRSLKKAFLLGSQQQSDREMVRQSLKYAIRGCRLEEALSQLTDGDQQGALSLYEQLGDLYCKVGSYSKAVEYYKLQLRCAEGLGRPDRELAVIHVSLAATFTDLRDFKQALNHYKAELELRKGNPVEECKTWLNMAVSVEEDGQGLAEVQRCLLVAVKCARAAGDSRLERKVLRQLLAAQQKWSSPEAADTEVQLAEMGGGSDGESSEEEEESSEPLPESDIELSQSEDDEDLEGYDKSVPGKRRTAQWNRRNEKGETVLHRACIDGNAKMVRCLLEKGHPLNPRDYCGWTPLHEACNHGHVEIVQMLLDRGANINDPGGPLCEGISPLHDALSSGNFHVAQLLISRGASVIQRKAKGVTPLGSLQEWAHVYGKHLDQETRGLCRDTDRLLRDAIAGRVPQTPQPEGELQDSELFDPDGSQPVLVAPSNRLREEHDSAHQERPGSHRHTSVSRSTSNQKAEDEGFALPQSPPRWSIAPSPREEGDSEDPLTPLKPVKKKPRFVVQNFPDSPLPEGGKEAYQRAIQSLGSAKSRLLSQSLPQPERLPEEAPAGGALVPSEEYLGDDWLEDDLRSESHPKKRVRRSPSPAETEEAEPSDSEEEGAEESPRWRDTPGESPRWRDTPGESPRWRETPEESPRWRERAQDGPAPRTLSLPRKRCRQTKLTQIVDRAVVGRTKSSADSDVPVPRMTQAVHFLSSAVRSVEPGISHTSQTPTAAALPPPMRVRVRVQDNVFLIPIPHSEGETRQMSWLAEEASQRYYQSCGLRPVLTLKKEGALLDPQDLILCVLQSNEEVLAEVRSWDLPPLTDRYRKACESLGAEESCRVRRALEQQEMGPRLSLCRLALRPLDVKPLLRAIKLQSSLRQLSLSGNVLGDGEMGELRALLTTTPHLTHLSLAANRLTHQGIRKLLPAPGLEEGLAYEKLQELDLSLNPLGDALTQTLAALLRHCPALSSLKLAACQLSAHFLQQHRLQLADAFRGALHLRILSLSHNRLGSTGVELILKTLPHQILSRLDLGAVTAGDSLMMEPVVRYLSQDGCVLSHLTLSSNQISDELLPDLARCLAVCPSLTSLDLSGNPKIGVKGLECLLCGIRERDQEMETLNLAGCSIRGPFTTSFLDGLSALLQELHLCSQNLSKKEQDAVTAAWGGASRVLRRHHQLFLKRIK